MANERVLGRAAREASRMKCCTGARQTSETRAAYHRGLGTGLRTQWAWRGQRWTIMLTPQQCARTSEIMQHRVGTSQGRWHLISRWPASALCIPLRAPGLRPTGLIFNVWVASDRRLRGVSQDLPPARAIGWLPWTHWPSVSFSLISSSLFPSQNWTS